MVLHRGRVPLTSAGLGTRRLAALSLQRAKITARSIILIDEIEHGLEPHRLLHLLNVLRTSVVGDEPTMGQIFLTTHSSEAVAALQAADLNVVRSTEATTSVQRLLDAFDGTDIDPQAIARAGAAALLARRVIVAEGKTEIGYVRALATLWNERQGVPLTYIGTTTTDGGGSQAASRAVGFAKLGYETALLVDSDTKLKPTEDEILEAGARLIQWDGGVSIEERIVLDLPAAALETFVVLAGEVTEDQNAVLNSISDRLPDHAPKLESTDPLSWVSDEIPLDEVRQAVGKAANRKKWFKDIDRGERLGHLVISLLDQMTDTDTSRKTDALERFAYGNEHTVDQEHD